MTLYKGTLSIPSLGYNLIVLDSGIDARIILQRSTVGTFADAGKTLLGAQRITRAGFLPYFSWVANAVFTNEGKRDTWLDYLTAVQSDPTIQLILKDEFNYVPAIQTSWHNRTIVGGSTVATNNGTTKSYCSFNVLMVVDEASSDPEPLAGGWYQSQFRLVELLG